VTTNRVLIPFVVLTLCLVAPSSGFFSTPALAADQLLAPPLRGSGPEAGRPAIPAPAKSAVNPHESMAGPSPHAGLAAGRADLDLSGIGKAENGKTVAEIFSGSSDLADQRVAVRGKVVKKNDGIMGRNWLHLRDGSKNADGSDADLTVTSQQTATVGDVVLAEGKVTTDKDFGFGYHYDVLLEDAKITVEPAK
jgi:hypothetical protein